MGKIGGKQENPSGGIDAFFERQESLITDYTQGIGVTFKLGRGWAVNPETGEATCDPKFFTEQGCSPTQAMFATLHECDHVVETARIRSTEEGKRLYDERKIFEQNNRRYHILRNRLDDIANNGRVLKTAPALKDETIRLYKEKLFPKTNYKGEPLHIQFSSAILRSSMVPDELVEIDEEVGKAIDALRHIVDKTGRTRDIIKIIIDPNLDPVKKMKLMIKYVHPVYEELFEKDKRNKQKDEDQRENDTDSGGSGGGESTDSSNGEEQFDDDYNKAETQSVPNPLEEEDVVNTTEKGIGGKSMAQRQDAAYEEAHGVSMEDVRKYHEEYKLIQHYLESMRVQFRRIIDERLIPKRRLKGFYDEGVLIAPGLAAQAAIDYGRGVDDSMVFMDCVGRVEREKVPAAFELTGVFDRSYSMESGGKKLEQRRAAILLMEALTEFMDEIEVKTRRIDPELRASSEARSFGGQNENVVIKPLSSELTERQRVEVFKLLNACTGGLTEDYIVLGQIIEEMKTREPGYLAKIKNREIKKLVVVFSDGGSSNQAEYDKRSAELTDMGVKIIDYRRIKDNVNFTSQMAVILGEALNDLCYPKKAV